MLRSSIILAAFSLQAEATEYFHCKWRTVPGEYHAAILIGQQSAEGSKVIFDAEVKSIFNDEVDDHLEIDIYDVLGAPGSWYDWRKCTRSDSPAPTLFMDDLFNQPIVDNPGGIDGKKWRY